MIPFTDAYISALSGAHPTRDGQFLNSTNAHGDSIKIDLSVEPPRRSLSLQGSDYDLETTVGLRDLQVPVAEFLHERDDINGRLRVLTALQSNVVQEHVADLVSHGYTLANIKGQVLRAYGLDISFIGSLDVLTDPARLGDLQADQEQALRALEQRYVQAMQQAIATQRKKVFEQDERTREVLEFVHAIGFDLIPKASTDQLMREVRSGFVVMHQLPIAPARLHLEAGTFGESETEAGGSKWKENLVAFFNLMMTGDPSQPINAATHLGV
ncbi:MAG: hypothetical protein H6981_14630 [Gammaproteobacteria bacterium]|nr:hypothetical protein [Gammaproteobacteria bacterium]MCP5138020.1 hypothetical protein [Gammaproteobacteria bacterium]